MRDRTDRVLGICIVVSVVVLCLSGLLLVVSGISVLCCK